MVGTSAWRVWFRRALSFRSASWIVHHSAYVFDVNRGTSFRKFNSVAGSMSRSTDWSHLYGRYWLSDTVAETIWGDLLWHVENEGLVFSAIMSLMPYIGYVVSYPWVSLVQVMVCCQIAHQTVAWTDMLLCALSVSAMKPHSKVKSFSHTVKMRSVHIFSHCRWCIYVIICIWRIGAMKSTLFDFINLRLHHCSQFAFNFKQRITKMMKINLVCTHL